MPAAAIYIHNSETQHVRNSISGQQYWRYCIIYILVVLQGSRLLVLPGVLEHRGTTVDVAAVWALRISSLSIARFIFAVYCFGLSVWGIDAKY